MMIFDQAHGSQNRQLWKTLTASIALEKIGKNYWNQFEYLENPIKIFKKNPTHRKMSENDAGKWRPPVNPLKIANFEKFSLRQLHSKKLVKIT